GRNRVVRALAHVHVIVRMYRAVLPALRAEADVGQIRQNFVGIHVVTGAGARRLNAVPGVGRNGQLAERVLLDPEFFIHGRLQLRRDYKGRALPMYRGGMSPRAPRGASWLLFFALFLLAYATYAGAPNVPLEDLAGKPHNTNEYIGKGRWVIVTVWSADCPICQREMYHMTFLHDEHKDKDARVLGFSIDGNANR